MKQLLPVLDDLERAVEAAVEHDEAKVAEGVRLVHRALADLLAREGLVEVETDGAFDPHMHEALLSQPSDEPEGTSSRCCRRATGSATTCCARRAWSSSGPPAPAHAAGARVEERMAESLLRDARRPQERLAPTRSRRPTASSPASTTRTATRATTAAERFKEIGAPTTCCPTPRSASSTTRFGSTNGRPGADERRLRRLRPRRHLRRPLRRRRPRPRRASRPQRGQRGADVEVEVRISFEDALQGRPDDGAGRRSSSPATPATARARRPARRRRAARTATAAASSRPPGPLRAAAAVPRCRGNGTIVDTPCPTCHGSGRERRTKRYTVRIPAGVKDGTRIKLKGKGEAGWGGAPPATSTSSRASSRRSSSSGAATTSCSTCRSPLARPRSARPSRSRRPTGACR